MDRRGFLVAGTAVALSACAHPERELLDEWRGADLALEPGPPRTTSTTTIATDDAEGGPEVVPDDSDIDFFDAVPDEDRPGLAFVATALTASITAHETPRLEGPIATFANPIASGGPLVFLVDDFVGIDRFRVLLPTRPNGTYGWIDGDDAELNRHNYAIRVSLDDHLLTLFEREQEIFETTVGVARENAPTPLGRYYTTELIRPIEPHSVYGAYAYGLSGYSDTFEEFAGGPGQLGIHGTNDPSTLGTNVSSGCIRLHNDDISLLVEDIGLPVGVPVEVV